MNEEVNESNILTRLREETAEMHVRMEENRYAEAIMKQSLTMEGYKEYLEKFYGFIKPVERIISNRYNSNILGFDAAGRGKAKLLEEDLLALGVTREELTGMTTCERLPDVSSIPGLVGYLYVMEGSTLGGLVITKQLKKFLPINEESNGRYFYSYGQEVRPKWNEFREWVLELQLTPEQNEMITSAAKETFDLLYRWVEGE